MSIASVSLPKKSSSLLWVALAATVGLTLWQAMQSTDSNLPEVVVPAERHQDQNLSKEPDTDHVSAVLPHSPQPSNGAGDRFQEITKLSVVTERTPINSAAIVDVFAVKNWYTPPPIAKLRRAAESFVSPPPPVPPPLDISYVGKLNEDDQIVVYLARRNKNYAVKVGDKIDNTYSVDQVTENTVVFTYLPLKIQQTLVFTGNR